MKTEIPADKPGKQSCVNSAGMVHVVNVHAARLTPLAVANLAYKLDATAYSVAMGGLSQTQIDAVKLGPGSWRLVLAMAVLIPVALAFLWVAT